MILRTILLAGAAVALASQAAVAAPASDETPARAATAKDAASADLAKLVADFKIPFQTFTLANGLKVIVMTDRTVPVVYTAISYDVGSTYEPAGKSGFAHLFEHIMFNGSENVPGDYMKHLNDAGVMLVNGGTSYDFTNYHQSVPTGSLDRVLFMESDRMGHLLGAVTQAVIDEQRGVVQNEKRTGDNSPGSIADYVKLDAIYPKGHPYGHRIIGSMKDLNAASLADVHQWFKDYYGPNNATMILAGDIDLATAKAKVEKYFGDIPRGRETSFPVSPLPVLKAPIERALTAPVSSTSIERTWITPGVNGPDIYALNALASLMTGIDGAPLPEKLVRQDKLFTGIRAKNDFVRGTGSFKISGTVRDGVDPKVAARALDAAVADFLSRTPSADALARFKSAQIIYAVSSVEYMEARANLLLEAATLMGSPADYKREVNGYLGLTPAAVIAAGRKWLNRPNYRMVLSPGPRMTPPGDESGGPAAAAVVAATRPVAPALAAQVKPGTRGPLPTVGEPGSYRFPAIQRATLKNGIPVAYAKSDGIPFTNMRIFLPFGDIDDPAGKPNVMAWMMQSLEKGAAGHDEHWFKQLRERTGVSAYGSADTTSASIFVNGPTASFDAALDTAMMLLTKPEFPVDTLDDLRRNALSDVKSLPTNAGQLANAAFANMLAPGSTYARLNTLDTAAEIDGITRADLQAAFERWVRPRGAKIYIASNEPLAALLPKLNATIGSWTVPGTGAAGSSAPLAQARTAGPPRIVLIDMPEAVQASVQGGQLVAIPYDDEALASTVANIALGEDFLSRINMNLREDKHWSYGARGSFSVDKLRSTYVVSTEIQPDKVGAGIAELRKEVADVLSTRPITQAEFDTARAGLLRKTVGQFRTASEVIGAVEGLDDRGRPEDFYTTYADRLRALTLADANAALKEQLDPSKWVWVVTGNAKVIRPQLEGLGLPIEVKTPAQVIAAY